MSGVTVNLDAGQAIPTILREQIELRAEAWLERHLRPVLENGGVAIVRIDPQQPRGLGDGSVCQAAWRGLARERNGQLSVLVEQGACLVDGTIHLGKVEHSRGVVRLIGQQVEIGAHSFVVAQSHEALGDLLLMHGLDLGGAGAGVDLDALLSPLTVFRQLGGVLFRLPCRRSQLSYGKPPRVGEGLLFCRGAPRGCLNQLYGIFASRQGPSQKDIELGLRDRPGVRWRREYRCCLNLATCANYPNCLFCSGAGPQSSIIRGRRFAGSRPRRLGDGG